MQFEDRRSRLISLIERLSLPIDLPRIDINTKEMISSYRCFAEWHDKFVCLFYLFNWKTNPHAIILYNSFLSQRKEFVCMKEKQQKIVERHLQEKFNAPIPNQHSIKQRTSAGKRTKAVDDKEKTLFITHIGPFQNNHHGYCPTSSPTSTSTRCTCWSMSTIIFRIFGKVTERFWWRLFNWQGKFLVSMRKKRRLWSMNYANHNDQLSWLIIDIYQILMID